MTMPRVFSPQAFQEFSKVTDIVPLAKANANAKKASEINYVQRDGNLIGDSQQNQQLPERIFSNNDYFTLLEKQQ